VDESGVNTAMSRSRGRAPPGERAEGSVAAGALEDADDDRGIEARRRRGPP